MEASLKLSKGSGKECSGRKVNEGEKDVEKLRCLFDQIIRVLCKDSDAEDKVESFLPLLSDGRSVDLFRLYEAVWMRGGCNRVCKEGLWDSVAVELGLGYGVKRGLKLIFVKYLDELDHRVSQILKVRRSRVRKESSAKNLDIWNSKLIEVKSNVNGFDDKWSGKEVDRTEFESSGTSVHVEPERGDLDPKIMEFARKLSRHWKIMQAECAKSNSRDNDEKVVSLNLKTVSANIGLGSRKRKRESVHSMLKWVTRIAKHPMKSAADINHKSKEYYAQTLLARRVLFVKGPDGGKEALLEQNKMMIQASYYNDDTSFNNQSTGIMRCSKRVSSMASSFLNAGSDKLRDPEGCNYKSFAHRFQLDVENLKGQFKPDHCVKESGDTNISSAMDISASWIGDIPAEKHTSVGPGYQAEVPEWTGLVTESDSKWLGTKMWPLEKEQNNALVNLIPVGRGRPDSCSCKFPGSVTCVRFHIAVKKLELKRELGSVFYLWHFDQMGEENALRWTNKEENRFTQMVRRNPPSEGKCFWDFAPRYLRKKTRYMLVSYYFNVFVLRRRRYQNGVTPNEIDSDDDEKEFETLGGFLGDEAISVRESNLLTCVDNLQCMELDKEEAAKLPLLKGPKTD
ncbi:unnamed protein product [Rhodiola kirilowii]